MTETQQSKLKELSEFVKPVFKKWENLRLLYNAILAATLVWAYVAIIGWEFPHPIMILRWLMGAVSANICFLAGPVAESYFTWVGFKTRAVTGVLFIGGGLISIPLVILFAAIPPFPHGFGGD